jgi:hypothetical protein
MAGQTITAVIAADAKPFKKGMQDASNSTSILTKSLKGIGVAAAAGFAVATAAAGAFLFESVKAADQSRQVSRGLETAVKNSKAFGKSATYIHDVTSALDAASTKLGELVGIDDEVISGLKRNWLAVPRIAATGVAGINKLATIAADVAAGTGKDLETVATAFTKAYGDPKGALAKLQKAGVVLTDTEKARYNALIKSGKETEALGFLADTLGKKFEGAAQAAASPFERLKVTFGNFQENIGAAFLPVIDKILPKLQTEINNLTSDPKFIADLQSLADTLIQALPQIAASLKSIADAIKPIVDFMDTVNKDPWTQALQRTGTAGYGAIDSYLLSQDAARTNFGKTATQNNFSITVNSVSSSAETGRAIVNAINQYVRTGGAFPGDKTRGPGR